MINYEELATPKRSMHTILEENIGNRVKVQWDNSSSYAAITLHDVGSDCLTYSIDNPELRKEGYVYAHRKINDIRWLLTK